MDQKVPNGLTDRGATVISVLVFTRDLRVADNPALSAAIAGSSAIVPLFVLDDDVLAGRFGGEREPPRLVAGVAGRPRYQPARPRRRAGYPPWPVGADRDPGRSGGGRGRHSPARRRFRLRERAARQRPPRCALSDAVTGAPSPGGTGCAGPVCVTWLDDGSRVRLRWIFREPSGRSPAWQAHSRLQAGRHQRAGPRSRRWRRAPPLAGPPHRRMARRLHAQRRHRLSPQASARRCPERPS
jgi:hypothetical protein